MLPNKPFNAGSTIILVNGLSSASHPTLKVHPSPWGGSTTSKVNFTGVGAVVAKVNTVPSVAVPSEVRSKWMPTPPVTLKEHVSPSH